MLFYEGSQATPGLLPSGILPFGITFWATTFWVPYLVIPIWVPHLGTPIWIPPSGYPHQPMYIFDKPFKMALLTLFPI